ncbi:Fe-only nitrogenase accessory AnfO family protein [uncultured Methanoregula sp.]|uniref:Fe-only nitrogenase accessory AnfO family protein n=1 Tax=uncultured Methanoregula sp. TaxID=1005933 RepID=UPI002AAC1A63|nr:Fe-only nitrogenase accessory AnfO family protein [uncultured Methanoregula sp.]
MCVSEIAVIMGSDGRTIPLSEPGTIAVYRRVRGRWLIERSFPFALDTDGGLAGLRTKTGELMAFLGNCRILVAQSASGALFFGLEKAGCQIYEITGNPPEFLDVVWQEAKDELVEKAPLPAGADIPAPLEIAPGKYYISIRDIQGKRPEVSSKQVLRPFVQQGSFSELEIVCDHVPPWIVMDAEYRGFSLHSENLGPGEVRVRLTKISAGPCGC